MNTFDLSPLFRSTIGFDRFARVLESALRVDQSGNGYPPYNIEKTGEDRYGLTIAVAGFGEKDLAIEVKESTLSVAGRKEEKADSTFLYRGIATRDFVRTFQLADHMKVVGASLDNGLLRIDLAREVPEAAKPRKIDIKAASGQSIEHKAA